MRIRIAYGDVMVLTLAQPWRPTTAQALLLRACTAPDAQLQARLEAWQTVQPWQTIDIGSHRLLPYLYRRLEQAELNPVVREKLKGVYLSYWTQYVRTTPSLLADVRAMTTQGFEPLLLKGTALQATVYGGDAPTRPTSDVDVLLTRETIPAAVDWLMHEGYATPPFFEVGEEFSTNKSLGLERNGREFDLNWWIYPFSLDPGMETRMTSRALEITIEGETYRTLALVDHLLHTILHGSGANTVPPIRWVLDAFLIAQRLTDNDWRVLLDEVEAGGFREPVLPMLRCLVDSFNAPVPAWVIDAVDALPVSAAGFLVQWHLTMQEGLARRVTRGLFAQYLADRAMTEGRPWRHALTRAPRVTFGVMKEFRLRQERSPR